MPTSEQRTRSLRGGRRSCVSAGDSSSSSLSMGKDRPGVRRSKTSSSMDRRLRSHSTDDKETITPRDTITPTTPTAKSSSSRRSTRRSSSGHSRQMSWTRRGKSPTRTKSEKLHRRKNSGDHATFMNAIPRPKSPAPDKIPRPTLSGMSASVPGHSLRRAPSPTENSIDMAREKAATVMARIDRRPSHNSFDDDRGRSGSLHNSFHSSVAARFLEFPGDESEGSDEFDLRINSMMGGINKYKDGGATTPPRNITATGLSMMGKLGESLSESLHSLRSLTHNFDGDSSDDESRDLEEEHEIAFSKKKSLEMNLFSNQLRKELHQVDQSVNLRDVEVGEYDWSEREGERSMRGKEKAIPHKSMVELFLSTSGGSGGGRKKRGFDTCYFITSFCCLILMIFLAASAFMMVPFLDTIFPESTSTSTGAYTTSSPTNAPTDSPPYYGEEETVSPTRPRPEVTTNLKSPFFDRYEVQQRETALEEILSQVEDTSLVTNTAAARKANAWIVAYDPSKMSLDVEDDDDTEAILQRYALAVFFFVTHPHVPPSSAPHEPITSREQEEDHERDDGRERHLLTFVDWMTASHICWWQGLKCNNNEDRQVIELDLSAAHLDGTLPPELGLLQTLQSLDLSHNRLQEDVPESWANSWTNLESLELHDNELTGTVPAEYCKLLKLETFTADCGTTDVECDCCSECL